MGNEAAAIRRFDEKLRSSSLKATASLAAAIAAFALLAWVADFRDASNAFRQSVPMHPSTSLLVILASVSLWLCDRKPSQMKTRIAKIFAAVVVLGGITRLIIIALGAGPAIDRWLFPSIPATANGLPSFRFTMAPVTSVSLIFIGAALFLSHLQRNKAKLLVYILTLIPALISLLTISRCFFVNLTPQSLGLQTYPVALSAAACFLLLTSGIAVALSQTPDEAGDLEGKNNRSSLANKLGVGFGAAVFMLCGVGIFSYQSIAEFIDDSRWDNHTYEVLAAIDELYANFKDAEGAERGFIITGNSDFLKTQQSAKDAVYSSLANIQALTVDNPTQQRNVGLIKPLIAQKLQIVQTLIAARRDMGFDTAKELLTSTPAVMLMDQIHSLVIAMSNEENRLLGQRMRDTEINARRGIVLIALSAAVALVIVLGAGWMLNRDIYGRERAEKALRASESLFRGLLQSAPDAMVITDEAGRIQLVNARTEQLFGYTAEQLIGQPINLLIPAIGGQQSVSGKPGLQGKRKDESHFPVEITHSPVQSHDGSCVSSAIRDVTQLRDEEHRLAFLNSALGESNTQLEAANKELEAFSYSVSHDLRAPLRSIDGFSQAILEDYGDKLDDEGQDHLNRVRAATQRMGHLIDDLLNLSRMTRVEMNREQVDLSKIAREIAEDLRATAPQHEVDLVIAENIVAYTDARLIRIVLTNLLNNAWKFTAKRQRAHIEFGCVGENGKAEFFVKDNGAGFDPAYSSRLFGAFQRLHSTTEYAGTGIGLATVQRIVRRQGGNIWAESKLDEGATFRFTL